MPRQKTTSVISARLSLSGDEGDALSLFYHWKDVEHIKARDILTSALLSLAGKTPTSEGRTAQHIIDTVTDNVENIIEKRMAKLLGEILEEFDNTFMKHAKNGVFIQGETPKSNEPSSIDSDQLQQMENFRAGLIKRLQGGRK